MANEILRSKHAFGMLENVLSAISSGKIDQYDVLFLKDANGKPYIGWVDKNNEPVILQDEKEIVTVPSLPSTGETGKIYIYGSDGYFWNGTEFINLCKPTDISVLETELSKLQSSIASLEANLGTLETNVGALESNIKTLESNVETKAEKADVEAVKATYELIKYGIDDVPVGTLVNFYEKEIRIMCPADSVFTKQAVGTGGDPNCYYLTFKTYVPNDDVVGYMEHLNDKSDSEILNTFSTDEYGRRYQPTWLAVARYDESTGEWSYYGKNSTVDKYIGWDYQIDWYNKDGKMIASDCTRINLSNEDCHSTFAPSYVNAISAELDKKIAEVASGFEIVEF